MKTNLPVGTLNWLYDFCNEFHLDYDTHVIVSDAVVAFQWKPYDLKLDLKSLLLK